MLLSFPYPDLFGDLKGVVRGHLSYADAFVLSMTCKEEASKFKRADAHRADLCDAIFAAGTLAYAEGFYGVCAWRPKPTVPAWLGGPTGAGGNFNRLCDILKAGHIPLLRWVLAFTTTVARTNLFFCVLQLEEMDLAHWMHQQFGCAATMSTLEALVAGGKQAAATCVVADTAATEWSGYALKGAIRHARTTGSTTMLEWYWARRADCSHPEVFEWLATFNRTAWQRTHIPLVARWLLAHGAVCDTEVVESMISRGADANLVGILYTAAGGVGSQNMLNYALYRDDLDVLDLLLARGCPIEDQSDPSFAYKRRKYSDVGKAWLAAHGL